MDIQEVLRNTFVASHLTPSGVRVRMLRKLGLNLGAGTAVASGVTFKGASVTTGKDCFLNHGVYVDRGALSLGDGVSVGPGVMFATRNHEIGNALQRAGRHIDQPITVGAGSWIGANATIMGGVTVAPGCVIGAGAVVTKDTEPDGLYLGVPATWVRSLN